MVRLLQLVCSAVVLTGLSSGSIAAPRPGAETIARSTDVAWLEGIVTAWNSQPTGAEPVMSAHEAKEYRPAAYARLGALGTAESLAAIHRIEDHVPVVWAGQASRFDRWASACWHCSDVSDEQRVATLSVDSGLTYTLLADSGRLGDADWFLLSASDSRAIDWQGPWLLPKPATPDRQALNLVYSRGRGILIAFTKETEALLEPLNPVGSGCVRKIRLEGITELISAKEAQQDSDGDGRTDLEEGRLGLDPRSIDSDGDGIPDGLDACPRYKAPATKSDDEDLAILQKAIFAGLGLSGSRDLLLVGQSSRRLQVWGYGGTILYDVNPQKWSAQHSAGLWVEWRLRRITESEAEVDISDDEGPRAAGGQSVHLRRIDGEWYVIERKTGRVS
jgi:hypothetical protein